MSEPVPATQAFPFLLPEHLDGQHCIVCLRPFRPSERPYQAEEIARAGVEHSICLSCLRLPFVAGLKRLCWAFYRLGVIHAHKSATIEGA